MVVSVKEFDSAKDFLNALVIEGPTPGLNYSGFVFRGVSIGSGENERKLVPLSLREEKFPELIKLSGSAEMPASYSSEAAKQEWIQARAEAKVLGSFFRHADREGLAMPEITSRIRQTMQTPGTSDALFNFTVQTRGLWPPDDLLPLAGQAQHYGLPTRLLDWSRDPWVAAYFSATGALKYSSDSKYKGEKLAVWVLNTELLDFEKRLARPKEPIELPLTLITAPASTNPNLKAQRGVFTVWRQPFVAGTKQKVDRRPLDELLEEVFSGYELKMPLLYKYTLPIDLASELWAVVRHNGVNAARIFPGFSGAAKAVMEDAKWK